MIQLELASVLVDIDSDDYRRGFTSGFVAPKNGAIPKGLSSTERTGWMDGYTNCQVPEFRLKNPMNGTLSKTPLEQDSGL